MAQRTPPAERELDVRDLDEPPFEPIMGALDALEPGETLRLVNSFEPEPLYAVIEGRGYDYETTQVADDEWHVAVTHP